MAGAGSPSVSPGVNPSVSVVIPVRNGARFIRDAVDSIFAQAGFDLEVIVVDNCSEDGSADVVTAAFGDCVMVTRESQPGAAHARNAGVRIATREYLAFLDADDVWEPQKLAKQHAALIASPPIDLLFCRAVEFADDDTHRRLGRPEPYSCVASSALFCRRETFLRAGEIPAVDGGEFIAWYGAATGMGMKMSVLPDVLVRRRIHSANSTRDPRTIAGYVSAAKWLLDRKRNTS